MGKKNNKKSISILNEAKKVINGSYSDVQNEIQDIQLQLYIADQKAKKKAKKEAKKKGKEAKEFYDSNDLRCQIRKKIIDTIESSKLLDRIIDIFKDIVPIVITIANSIIELIKCILNIDSIKTTIKPETLKKMNDVCNKALNIV